MASEAESGQELNATQLDAQRARHLLDRALGLAERDDVAGAIVTCRQSLVLAPNSPQGWSMLGLLHERDGDLDGAIAAYEKTLQLSPGSTLERESLQRLRQKRGAAPRPVPKFHFDDISNSAPQVPLDTSLPAVPARSVATPLTDKPAGSLWDAFYFRSLPVLIAALVCLGVIVVAQGVAANRQSQRTQNIPVAPTNLDPAPAASAQPVSPAVAPGTLVPPASSTEPQDPPASAEIATPTPAPPKPTPAITPTSKPKAVARPKPKPKPRPRVAVPHEMPVLPPPRLTLPKQSAPAPAISDEGTSDASSTSQPVSDGGPVDVGNSEDSQYIPVNPPHFPNASRRQR